MSSEEQKVSTDAQRQALEAMSANLISRLNIMISEQERRAQAFAALTHSTQAIPKAATQQSFVQPEVNTPQPKQTTAPPPPAQKPVWETEIKPNPVPRIVKPAKKQQTKEEESNVGMGMIIFALVGILMLLRSCS